MLRGGLFALEELEPHLTPSYDEIKVNSTGKGKFTVLMGVRIVTLKALKRRNRKTLGKMLWESRQFKALREIKGIGSVWLSSRGRTIRGLQDEGVALEIKVYETRVERGKTRLKVNERECWDSTHWNSNWEIKGTSWHLRDWNGKSDTYGKRDTCVSWPLRDWNGEGDIYGKRDTCASWHLRDCKGVCFVAFKALKQEQGKPDTCG